jgi:hypothetical protein
MMLQRLLSYFLVGLLAIAMAFIPSIDRPTPLAIAAPIQNPSNTITIQGVIKLVGVEGGCYQLIATDGSKYELVGKFPKRDGLKVKVQGVLKPDLMTICQVGRPFQVSAVQVLKK